jgi:hypothetical protein
MLMRPKHPLVRLQALNVSGDLMGRFTHFVTACRASKLGRRSHIKDGMIIVIS